MDGPALKALAASGRPGDWSARSLPARCARLRLDLAAAGIDAGALDAAWPGGAETPKGRDAWQRCFARYQFLKGTRETRRPTDDAPDTTDRLQRAIIDSLTDRHEVVWCSDGGERAVYPKSYHVHEVLSAIDADVARLTAPEDAALRSRAVRTWVWIVTAPGVDLPYDDGLPRAEPPAWTRALSDLDVALIVSAFNRVDRETIAVHCAAFPARDGAPSRLSFAGFLGTFAASKHLDPLDVTRRRWAVRRVLATAVSEAVTHDEAQTRADAARAAAHA